MTTTTSPRPTSSSTAVRVGFTGLLLVAICGLAGCGGGDDQARAAGGGAGATPPGAGRRSGPDARPPVPVAVVTAERGTIASTYAATATLGAEKEADVLARVSGVVDAIEQEEGDLVAEGDALLRIENDEYRLRLAQA